MKKQSLLPIGFYDLLFDEAEKNHRNINSAIDLFLKNGYRLFKAPLVEFEDNFLQQKSQNYFRTVDVFSGKNLVFRNDITPQISRILNSRLQEEKLPLKLCYVGDVLCAKNDELYKDRQQTQVGVEIIGCDEEKSNFEIIKILLEAITILNKENQQQKLLIEFSLPNFLEIFLDENEFENKAELKEAIIEKNISTVKKLSKKNSDLINKIMLSNHDLKDLEKDIFSLTKSEKIAAEINRAKKILDFFAKNSRACHQITNDSNQLFASSCGSSGASDFGKISSDGCTSEEIYTSSSGQNSLQPKAKNLTTGPREIKICFDLFGEHKDSYHKDIAFDVFSGDLSYPIARGGRYKINVDGKEVNSVGATIYMNLLRK
ncbi:MAG: ATP phosphoribosyltransferase regulatory subunit [Rickettsiales bacterium]|nr:ATP phosphoribosyltransferase regulatory subunit [Rickettsiales bacterium]